MIFLKAQIIIYCLLILILNMSLKNLTTESPKISRNYSISRYSDHSRLLDMPFTLLVTLMTRPTTLYNDSRHDSKNFGNDSWRLGLETDDLRLDSGLETGDSRLDSGLGPWKKRWLETRHETRHVWLGTRLETRQSWLVHSSDQHSMLPQFPQIIQSARSLFRSGTLISLVTFAWLIMLNTELSKFFLP